MESDRDYKGLKKYETLLELICRIEDRDVIEEKEWVNFCNDKPVGTSLSYKNDYSRLSESEWEGCLGVACIISINEGVIPNLFSVSNDLDIPTDDIHLQRAFERLRVNGVLSKRFGTCYDPNLNGRGRNIYLTTDNRKKVVVQTGAEVERNAWCTIAGIASGYVGMAETENI